MVHSVFYNIQKLTSLEEPSLFLRFAISFSLNPNVTVSKRFKKYAILNYLVNRNRKCQWCFLSMGKSKSYLDVISTVSSQVIITKQKCNLWLIIVGDKSQQNIESPVVHDMHENQDPLYSVRITNVSYLQFYIKFLKACNSKIRCTQSDRNLFIRQHIHQTVQWLLLHDISCQYKNAFKS